MLSVFGDRDGKHIGGHRFGRDPFHRRTFLLELVDAGREILDAERLQDGPVATVHLPMRAPIQVHGWWVPEWQMPTA